MKRILAGILLLIASAAQATTFMPRPFPSGVKDARAIVRGTIGESNADWGDGSDGNRRIYTYTELDVQEVFKGSLSSKRVLIREMGGEKDGVGLQVAGTARFKRGEDAVVFLQLPANVDGSYDVRGMMMGKYDVVRDEKGEEVLRGPGITGATHPVLRHDPDDAAENDTLPPTRWTLDALRTLVSQQETAETPKETQQNPIVNGTASPEPRAEQPAPRLQPSAPEEGEAPPRNRRFTLVAGVILGFLLLGVSMGVSAIRRKRYTKKV